MLPKGANKRAIAPPPRAEPSPPTLALLMVAVLLAALSLWIDDFYGKYRETQMRGQVSALAVSYQRP